MATMHTDESNAGPATPASVAPTPAAPDARGDWPRWAGPAISVVVFGIVIVVLHHALGPHRVHDVIEELRGVPVRALALAGLLTAASYLCLTLYDWLALRYVGRSVGYARTALTSFVAWAFGHNLSLAAFTGAAIRYRLYATQGLTAIDVALVVSFCTLTTALGLALTGGVALVAAVPGASALEFGHAWSRVAGWALLAAAGSYATWAVRARRPVVLGAWELRPPGSSLTAAQVLVAVADLAFAGAALWVLLPAGAAPDLATFAGLYALAVLAGIVSQVPAGLGVFEAVLLLALPQVPPPQLLGALLAYRAVYYLAPLVLAAAALLAHESWAHRHRVARLQRSAGAWITPWLVPIAPQLIGVFVFIAGAVLLLSGATPSLDTRLAVLRGIVPLPLLEVSHLAGSVAGLGLLVLARGLFRRLASARRLTLWLLAAGIVASLAKGLDVEEAAYLTLVFATLYGSRSAFYRPASFARLRFTPGWLAGIGIIVVLTLWIGMLAFRHVPYSNELWWTFALHGDAPRMLRASFAIVVVLAGVVAANLLQTPPAAPAPPGAIDDPRVATALARADFALANAVHSGDKRLLFHPAGDAFVMYQVSGRSWIALGDPVGAPERREDLVWSFRELVDLQGGRTVFYQVGRDSLPLYVDLGLSLVKLGEEARVPLPDFTLEGSARAELRQARRRGERAGCTFEVLPPERVVPLLPRLRAISDAWLDEKSTAEKGFSLGAFGEDYVARFPVAIVRCEGTVVAFANLWPTGTREELSVDLMRFGPDAPRGSMDYLFIELMLWGREAGYGWFNLGMAPLSGLENRALAPLWHRTGSFLYRHGESFYNFDGLRRYKEKFAPVWEPRYLASPGGLQLPRVLLDVSTLISGGLRELVGK